MIAYALIMTVSLATGQPVHASLEGPMPDGWCSQLIQQAHYHSRDGTTQRSASCVGWQEAQRLLALSYCTHGRPGATGRTRQYECGPPSVRRPSDPDSYTVESASLTSILATVPDPTLLPLPSSATAAPYSVSVPPHQELYTGVLVHNRHITVVPKIFSAADCPASINTRVSEGHTLYVRCMSLAARQRLLQQARCGGASVDAAGTRRYACQNDPARYLGQLSAR
jgi:hypothetical protein